MTEDYKDGIATLCVGFIIVLFFSVILCSWLFWKIGFEKGQMDAIRGENIYMMVDDKILKKID